jgi:hypothetical protein
VEVPLHWASPRWGPSALTICTVAEDPHWQGQAAPVVPRNHHIHPREQCWPHDSYAFVLSRDSHMVLRNALAHHSPFGAGRGGALVHAPIEMGRNNSGECGLYMLVLTELKIGGRTH